MDFAKIAPYLKDPLVLVGFSVFLAFLFARALLQSGIIPQLSRALGYRVLQRVLLYGFVIGLALIALGFGLKYRELSAQEQAAAVSMLQEELDGDIRVLSELKSNTETILNQTTVVSGILRTPKIKLLAALFPPENLDIKAQTPASADMANEALEHAKDSGLVGDDLENQKFQAAGQAIAGTIQRTLSTVRSLADADGKRYLIKDEVWWQLSP